RSTGVDQNLVAVEQARKLGLDVHHGDLFETLKSSKDACHRLVSAFHVIEHLPWEMQLKLFTECHRVIAPDGILIIEWPNTDNISVASQHFWLDPTHVRPLPVLLASFMAEYAGFKNIEIKKFRSPIFQTTEKLNKITKRSHSFLNSLSKQDELAVPPELQALADSMKSGSDVALICSR
ncbi:class I SAM-dependent methyltransferase, partial [Enterococcus faecalis]|uniref:class I SAM-dependent methyltransferase n=1 Tax=Enterococcus faecalis TaxID=1351 RepID=UPI0034E5FDF5